MSETHPEEDAPDGDEPIGRDDKPPQSDAAEPDAHPTGGASDEAPSDPPKARSEAQRQASQHNGAKSRGATSPEGKATVSRNAVTHSGYAEHLVIGEGVFAEDQGEYLERLDGFLKALKPVNAAARQEAEYLFQQHYKSDRVDRFEAQGLEHVGRMPDQDPHFDLKVAALESKLDLQETLLGLWEDISDRFDEGPSAMWFSDWEHLWTLANDPALRDLKHKLAEDSGSPEEQAATIAIAQPAIEHSLAATCGSVEVALKERITTHARATRSLQHELDGLKKPLTETEYGTKVAHALVTGNYFDRLSRPRATIDRAMRHSLARFMTYQALGPDTSDEPDDTAQN